VGLIWVLTTQLFPLAMMLVPFYILATSVFPDVIPGLKLTNSIFGLIIIYSATALPFAIWMLKGYFDTVPVDLEEAAAIDGASLFQLLFLILFPLTRPAIFTAFLFSFVQAWNEYAIANLFLTLADKYTLPVGLRTLLDNNNMAGFATAAVVASVPVVILFLSMKKELVEGATLGAVKG
jgi:arabinogalactan oligomer/maltooligosaccharide transport system permease protein